MMRKCNVCGKEFDSQNDAKQCSKECRWAHAAKHGHVPISSNNNYNVNGIGTCSGSYSSLAEPGSGYGRDGYRGNVGGYD